MSKENKMETFSRRSFVKGVGAGLMGSYTLLKPGRAAAKAKDEKAEKLAEIHEGKTELSLTVNGKKVRVLVEPRETLAELLRERLQLTGTKISCNHGECGSCTVLLDGRAVYSCHMLALDAAGGEVLTIEGLLTGDKLHPIQEAFLEHDGLQCGFCTPGQIMSAQALLNKTPRPTRDEVLMGMSGNICRCSAYPKIIESVLAAAERK